MTAYNHGVLMLSLQMAPVIVGSIFRGPSRGWGGGCAENVAVVEAKEFKGGAEGGEGRIGRRWWEGSME